MTSIWAAPAGLGGVVAFTEVLESTVTDVAGTPPKLTSVAPSTKLAPLIVTSVPPTALPELTLSDEMVGGGMTVIVEATRVAGVPVLRSWFTLMTPGAASSATVTLNVR